MWKRNLVFPAILAIVCGLGTHAGPATAGGPLGSVRLEHPS
jgi:hypothetical protein